ncbi:hypothetical protein [Enterococcus sp. JM9B]|uniref:hypothetical protein n=1 Tax=Enterococcus sp. JM9B TaxID=1857216 RepID=UPI0013753462|nr:hypothetical protein [Enterococcus sp. JM9B]KAF1302590.1 hypothetical protein BAU16_06530 [Enterococcus sp. JM9B]
MQQNQFANKWAVNEDELSYMIENYNAKYKKQPGEAELKRASKYEEYKVHADNPVPKLKYWKCVINEFGEMMHEEILPLQDK